MHQQLIPERDSGPIPRPKPRSRSSRGPPSTSMNEKLINGRNENDIDDVISLSSISSATTGFDNQAYIHDEEQVIVTDKPAKYYSSDSDTEKKVTQRYVFSADVHNSNENQNSSPERSDSQEVEPTKLRDGRFIPPKPRPRNRSQLTDSDASGDNTQTSVESYSHEPKLRAGENFPKPDHLTISMPAEKEDTAFTKVVSHEKSESTGFVSKWKNAAQALITKVPTKEPSRSQKSNMAFDTRIDIENLEPSSQGNLEMRTFSKDSKGPEHTLDTVEGLSETKPYKKTKTLLARGDDGEIERLKGMITPPVPSDMSPGISSPSKRQRRRADNVETPEKYFGVTIHSCDLLPIDPNIIHPVVKVILLNEDGTMIPKYKVKPQILPYLSRSKKIDKSEKRKHRNKDMDIVGKRKDSHRTTSQLSGNAVLPIMTQPCKLGYPLPTLAPTWNELLVFDEPFSAVVMANSTIMLFFEVMDFLPANSSASHGLNPFKEFHGSEDGWYKIAWGFLKVIGANGARNINRKIRLQLYKPERLAAKHKKDTVEVYQWWKLQYRRKINSTLNVTVTAVPVTETQTTNFNPLLTSEQEKLSQNLLERQRKSSKDVHHKGSSAKVEGNPKQDDIKLPEWRRLEGQICKIPNKLLMSLPTSPVDALNLNISGNVYCVKFSPCGLKLAAGLDSDTFHTILVFEMVSGKLLFNIRCHHGLIYDLDWRVLDNEITLVPKLYHLASASADMTASVWELYNSNAAPKLVKKLLHPSFVYCVRIHPTKPRLVFTGCFDYAIRIWDVHDACPSRGNGLNAEVESVPLALLDKHESYVNCLAFASLGNYMYSGDGSGCVFEWENGPSGRKKSWRVSREMTFREMGKSSINCLQVHPTGNRLLVHIRSSCIKIIDLASLLTLHTLTGSVNDKLQVRSCFSPCGNLVLSGSEDSTLCIWDADTASVLQFITPESHRHCVVTSVDYHPHDYFVVIGLASTISEPCPVILYTHKQAEPAKLRLKTIGKLASLNKSRILAAENSADEQVILEPSAASLGIKKGDSTEKFMMIVKKLDAALQATRKSKPTIRSTISPTGRNEFGSSKTEPKENEVAAEFLAGGENFVSLTTPKATDPLWEEKTNEPMNCESIRDETLLVVERRGELMEMKEMDTSSDNLRSDHHSFAVSSFYGGEWNSLNVKPNVSTNSKKQESEGYAIQPEKLERPSQLTSPQVSKVRQKRRERRKMLYE